MFAKRVFSQFLRNRLNHCPRVVSCQQEQLPFLSSYCHSLRGSTKNELLDPFSLVSDEVLILANRLRAMVVAEVPKLSSAAGYFFKIGVEGKRVCPTVLLLMASALNMSIPKLAPDGVNDTSLNELRKRQWCIAEISELIHVTSLIHDDVLDDAETRRGIGSLNFVMGNKGLAYQLIDDVLDFTGTSASLGKGSLSDIRHGIVTAPILFAMEEFPHLRAVVNRGFDNPSDVDLALDYLGKSRGIERTRELASEYAILATAAINSFPESDDEEIQRSRQALVDLTQIFLSRAK